MKPTIRTFLPTQTLALALGLAAPATSQSVEVQDSDPLQGSIPATFHVRDLLDGPLIDATAEPGAVWVRDQGQRLRFAEGSIEVLPVFGPTAEREWPVRVTVHGATVGAEAIDVSPIDAPFAQDTRVIQPRAALRGVHHLAKEGFEQTFVFDALPTRGEISLQLLVETELDVETENGGLSFVHPKLGRVDVGAATAIDADGRSTSVERRWVGEGIELVVPAAFVEAATLPLTIDPVWTSFANDFGGPDDGHSDIVFAGESERYVVVWEEATSQSNRDVYATYFDSTLSTRSGLVVVDMTNEDWSGPAIAYVNRNDRALVAARAETGAGVTRIAGRLINVPTFTPFGGTISISSVGVSDKRGVDVGGSNSMNLLQSSFAVTWSRAVSPGDADIQYRLVRDDGSFTTPFTTVNGSPANDIQVAISQGLGDTSFIGDNWHIVWIREGNNDGRGDLWGMRLHYSGQLSNSSSAFLIDSSGDYAHPSVSSLFDEADSFTGERGAIVVAEAFKFDNLRPGGFRTDIEARLISDDGFNGERISLTRMEDDNPSLLQTRPQVSTDGAAFYVTYLEEEPTMINGGVWNVFMTSGDTIDSSLRTGVALGERHVQLAAALDSESGVSMTSRWNGERNSSSKEGAALWTVLDPNLAGEYGELQGAGFRHILPFATPIRSVGVQYGQALPTTPQDDATGWMRVLGDQNLTTPHVAQAVDLPPDVFGFLLVSREPAVVDNPGGSAGRLLLGGQIGRYVDQIDSSGTFGRMTFSINPLSLPQPNGAVSAMANETWHFQAWHRDSQNGLATSNLTNAVRVTFTN
ncbi:MAG: hypothetical protein AAF726_03610 [Planctomycetota bacterium]